MTKIALICLMLTIMGTAYLYLYLQARFRNTRLGPIPFSTSMLAVYSKILQKRLSTNDDIESIVKEAYYFAESGKPGPLVSIIQKGSLTGKAWNSHLRISWTQTVLHS